MKAKTVKIVIAALAVLLLAGVGVYAATNYGTRDDPLITKSYLDEVLKPQLESDLQSRLDAAASEMLSSAPGEFAQVELSAGQTLQCAAGSQILPVRGSLSLSEGALSDTTAGAAAAAGQRLEANHLYLSTEAAALRADAAAAVLVSGTYRTA